MDRHDKVRYAELERQQEEAAYRRKLQRDLQLAPHPTDTPEYWRELARSERAFADEDRARRGGSAESVRLHEANAAEYEAKAVKLEAEGATLQSKLLRGRFTRIADLRRYLEAGNALLTIRSKQSGTRFTLKATRPSEEEHANRQGPVPGRPRPIWVKVLTGPDNTADYAFVGTLWPENSGYRYAHSPKSRLSLSSGSVTAIRWLAHALTSNPSVILEQAEVWHEGRCGRCGRRLTVPESVESGFGPECAGILGVDR